MTIRAVLRLAAIALIVGWGGNPAGSNGDGDFRATIDGVAWSSTSATREATGVAGATFTIVGCSGDASAVPMSIILTSIDHIWSSMS